VGKRIVKKWDLPSGQSGALAVLGLVFALGGAAGCVLAAFAGGEGAEELCSYLSDYVLLAKDGALPQGFWPLLWRHGEQLLALVLLGSAALGVVGIPLLFGLRGFFFSFSVACFCRVFGGRGVLPAFALFGLPALSWMPAYFLLGVESMSSSQQLLSRSSGDGRSIPPSGRARWCRIGLCVGLTAAAVAMEHWVVPVLFPAIVRVVL